MTEKEKTLDRCAEALKSPDLKEVILISLHEDGSKRIHTVANDDLLAWASVQIARMVR